MCFFRYGFHTLLAYSSWLLTSALYSRRKVGLSGYWKVLHITCIRPDIELALLILLLMCLSKSTVLSNHIPKSFSSVTEVSGTLVQLFGFSE